MDPNDKIAIISMIAFILLDIISGVASAYALHEISSQKLREGLWHKLGYFFVLFCAILIEWIMTQGLDLGFSLPLVVPICVWVSLMEIISTLENAAKMNPDLESVPGFERLKEVAQKEAEVKEVEAKAEVAENAAEDKEESK